ncbi:MAG: DUF6599 family protein [Bacteroidales bacterium]
MLLMVYCIITALAASSNNDIGGKASLILPADADLKGWYLADNVQHIPFDSACFYAPCMHKAFAEYGLKELILAVYTDASEHLLNVEIYHMEDDGGAYGLFSVNRGNTGVSVQYGDESFKTEREIHYWKGDYYVRIWSESETKEVMDGICEIAAAFDNKDIAKGFRPELTNVLPEEGFVTESTRYFRGSAGLKMLLPFGQDDISGFSEGIYSDFGTHRLIIFEFECAGNMEVWLGKLTGSLKNQKWYTDFSGSDSAYLFEDTDGNKLVIGVLDAFVLVYIGKDVTRQPEIFEKIEDILYNENPEYPFSGIIPVF